MRRKLRIKPPPIKEARLELRLPEETLRVWREHAWSNGVSLSEFIRQCVKYAIENQ